jgi:acetolactate decarboxylase
VIHVRNMNISAIALVVLVGPLLVAAPAIPSFSDSRNAGPRVAWQNMPVIALLNGDYAGTLTVGEAKRHGDLGLGAFGELDGEMLEIDGVIYQVTSDGKVHVPGNQTLLSYALLTHFDPQESLVLPVGTTFAALGSALAPKVVTANAFYAIRMKGTFKNVVARALPKQSLPYPPFCQVQKVAPAFTFHNITGEMVGFIGPPYVGNFDTAGFHLHFLSQDRLEGGHALSFTTERVTVELDRLDTMQVEFPHDPQFQKAMLNQVDTCP